MFEERLAREIDLTRDASRHVALASTVARMQFRDARDDNAVADSIAGGYYVPM